MSQNGSYIKKNWDAIVKSRYPDVDYLSSFPEGINKEHPFSVCKEFSKGENHPELLCYTYFVYKDKKVEEIEKRNLDSPQKRIKYIQELTPKDYNEYVFHAVRLLNDDLGKLVNERTKSTKEKFEHDEKQKIIDEYSSKYEEKLKLFKDLSFSKPVDVLLNLVYGVLTSLVVLLLSFNYNNAKVYNLLLLFVVFTVIVLIISSICLQASPKRKIKKIERIQNDRTR